ncbi:M91 family zinc metallopeptidase [Dactylosporangium sp. AC04546]|uniref:M91 family zinc metallopeptidase n=1 Tax=Dactylosporangium sp. AC04546 TaxID=2862460 RepID=UPI001EE07A10|nr:M91 family zinc metallopeptidase [Dactylosporangium sp. AC04546]WVK84525.1 M91 family zinc metallopeptidase [Dactylosporangium sp. AC04546]
MSVWDLRADPAAVEAAAGVWWAVGNDLRAARELLDRAAAPVEWAGDTADTYRSHRARLGRDLERAATTATATAVALGGIGGLLRRGQAALDDAYTRQATETDAATIRADVDQELVRLSGALAAARREWADLRHDWAAVVAGRMNGWLAPTARGADGFAAGGLFVVNTGDGDDVVEIRGDAVVVNGDVVRVPVGARVLVRTGGGNDTVRVSGGGAVTVLGGDGDDRLSGSAGDDTLLAGAGSDTVVAGWGDDRVSLGPGTSGGPAVEHAYLGVGDDRLWGSLGAEEVDGGAGDDLIFAGAGDDTVAGGLGDDLLSGGAGDDDLTGNRGDDAVFGEDGRDYTDGGAGRDLVDGGAGDDTVYGLSGDDVLRGGDGADFLEGGTGDDRLDGGAGADVLSGGRGADTLDGGDGDDVLYSGAGADAVTGGDGDDRLFGQAEDSVGGVERLVATPIRDDLGTLIVPDGDREFEERVQADLDLLRASPTGQQMLAALDVVVITPTEEPNGFANSESIRYNPGWQGLPGSAPPVVTLFHELAHTYDHAHGTTNHRPYNGAGGQDVANGKPVPNYERQAVGLPIDHDGDPGTPNEIDPAHPLRYTENGLREEFGLPLRATYGSP